MDEAGKGRRLLCLALAALLCGCARAPVPVETAPSATAAQIGEAVEPFTPAREETAPPPTEPPVETAAVEAPGILVERNEAAVIDYSNTGDGYVMVQYTAGTDKKLRAQVKGPTTTYTYHLTPGKWAVFPLSDGEGTYQVRVYENVTGSRYAAVLSLTTEVTLTDPFAPFLRSNQYVNFDEAPETVAVTAELCRGAEPLEKVARVYQFVVQGMVYDRELAGSVTSGYVPALDTVLSKMSGICFDYASLMTGMLRSQGVPCKLVVGYAGEVYHAWISVWSEETGWIEGVIFFDGRDWKRMDPTFASSAGEEILDYIGNDGNYTAKYVY